MSDQEDTSTAPAARGGSSSRGARPRRDDDRGRPSVLGTDAILFQLTTLAGLAALSRSTKISLVTSSASFCSSAYNSGGCSRVARLDGLLSLPKRPLSMTRKNAPGWTCRRSPQSWCHATLHSGKKHQASEGVCGAKPHDFFYFFYFFPVKIT